jgi:hypothetical protein
MIPVHVWEEVLGDRYHEGDRFDLERALELWQYRYAPVLYVVDTAGLPMTPQAKVLAGRDASDVPMLLLAGVVAPVVIIGTDDLVDSGLAVADWLALRAALGHVGVTAGKMADLERQMSFVINITGSLIREAGRVWAKQAKSTQVATVAVVGLAAAGALLWNDKRISKKGSRVPSPERSMLPELLEHASKRLAALSARHSRGEDRWRQAELGTPGDTLLHQVALTLVGSRDPLTRTAIVERLGEGVPGTGHAERMVAVLDVLTTHPMFVDVTRRGHWQVGRLGGR